MSRPINREKNHRPTVGSGIQHQPIVHLVNEGLKADDRWCCEQVPGHPKPGTQIFRSVYLTAKIGMSAWSSLLIAIAEGNTKLH